MATNLAIPFAQILTQALTPPQRVIHVNDPAAGQVQPAPVQSIQPVDAFGSPTEYDIILAESMDYSGGDLPIDDSDVVFGDPNTELDYVSRPSGEAYGGIFDSFLNASRSAARSTRNAGAQAVNSVKRQVMGNRKQINTNTRMIRQNSRNVAKALSMHRSKMATVINKSEKEKWMAAVLAAAQALPGVKSYRTITGAAHQATVAGITEFFTTLKSHFPEQPDELVLTTVDAAGGGEAAAIQAVSDQLQTRDNELLARITAIEEALGESMEKAEGEKFVENVTLYGKQVVTDTLTDLAALLPSQFGQKDAALLEAGIKYVLGDEGDGTSGFNFSLG